MTAVWPALRARRWWTGGFGTVLLIALLFVLFIWPIGMLVAGIFREGSPGEPTRWTLDIAARVLTSSDTYAALEGSLIYAVASTFFGVLLGAFFAFLVARTEVPLAGSVTAVMLMVFAVPHIMYALGWGLLTDPSVGMLNIAARAIFGVEGAVFNVYSWTGLIFVHVLKLASFCYLMLLPAFQGMNRSLEEASLVAGASRVETFFLVDLPLLTPALFGVVILGCVFSLGAFDLPQILGGLAGIRVISTEIFKALNFSMPPDYAGASALGIFMMIALVLLLVLQWKMFGRDRFVTVTGKGYRKDAWNLGRWRYLCTALILLYALFALVLPGIQMLLTSMQPSAGVNVYSLDNYRTVLADPLAMRAFRVTAALALLGGFLAVALAAAVAYVARHSPRWLEVALDGVSLLPIIMPGVVMSVGLLWAYVSVPGLRQLYGTFWLALIGIVVFLTPAASRIVRGGIVQLSRELEEAGRTSGASHARVMFDIVLPLLAPALFAGWLVTAIIGAGTLDFPLLLLPPTIPNVSVLAYSYMSSGQPASACALFMLLIAFIVGLTAGLIAIRHLVRRLHLRRQALQAVSEFAVP
ncbi:MAG: iron ABC transporter permease [Burkholderiales bacterium]|nr:iron ABC transporter permease [Burkholderiales bacterium]ODU68757.1 MAG: hypothetical protein ABT05_02550 [Lautropia sp. SCN 66-9]